MNAIKTTTLVTLSAMLTSIYAIKLESKELSNYREEEEEEIEHYKNRNYWFTAKKCAFRFMSPYFWGDWVIPYLYEESEKKENSQGAWCRWRNFDEQTCKCTDWGYADDLKEYKKWSEVE